MCTTMQIGAAKTRGSLGMSSISASTPPADAPITTTRSLSKDECSPFQIKQEEGPAGTGDIESAAMAARKKKAAKPRAAAPKKSFVRTLPDDALDNYVSSVFPIVGVGASAGGLEAMTEMMRNVPEDAGAAFVFIQHHDAKTPSALPQILGRATKMPVRMAADGAEVA